MTAPNALLTPDQTVLWNLERRGPGLHVAGLALVDGEIDREELLRWMSRLRRLPRFSLRVDGPPYGPPRWRSAPFELDEHLHVVPNGEPASAFDESLGKPLDSRRPLWEFHLAPGYHEGGDALLIKSHLVAVDGLATGDLFHALFASGTTVEEKEAGEPTSNGVRCGDRGAEWLEYWTRVGQYLEAGLQELFSEDTRTALLTLNETMPDLALPPAPMPFNRNLGGRRRLIRCAFSYRDIRLIRARLGGALSDVVVALAGGALERYLDLRGVSTRGRSLRVALATDLPERDRKRRSLLPIEVPLSIGAGDRLRTVHQLARLMRTARVADVLSRFAGVQGAAGPLAAAATAMTSSVRPPFHLTVANANGPQIPQFLAGRALSGYTPSWPVGYGQGLSCAFFAYNQALHVGVTVDERACPDADVLPDLFAESFDELLEAAGRASGSRMRSVPPPSEPRQFHNLETP